MNSTVRHVPIFLFAVAAAVIGMITLVGFSDSSIQDLHQAVVIAAQLLALLSLATLVFHVVAPGAIEWERIAALAIGVSAGAALSLGGWGPYLPLTAAVAVFGVMKFKSDQ